MKKFLSLIIGITFIFTSLLSEISVNAFNFTNLGENNFYYGQIIGELKKGNTLLNQDTKTIFLIKEKNGTIHQIFSSKYAEKIKNLFLNKNNVKILGQSYKNPNNKKYAGIFVNEIINLDLPKIIKKDKEIEKEIEKEIKKDPQLQKYLKKYFELEYVIKNINSLDQKILNEIKKIGCEKIKIIFENKNSINNSEKFIFNELNNINGFEKFLNLKLEAKKEKFNDKRIIKLFSQNLLDKELNKKTSKLKLEKFLEENNSEEILKTALSKDFKSQTFGEFKINLPQNFDYQEIKIGNQDSKETFSRIYLKDFYSNILSFDFNQVQKFSKINSQDILEKSQVKLAGNYGEKIILNDRIIFQIKNKGKNGEEKFEISYSTLDKNFTKIFENILNKIEIN